MINSKVNFYFYKKRQSKQMFSFLYIKHMERILLSELQVELDFAKAMSPEGEGRPSCSWVGLASCSKGRGQWGTGDPRMVLAIAESCQFQPRKRVKPC